MNPRPDIAIDFDSLPAEPAPRHEALVDFFGQHLFWCRHQSCDFAHRAVSSPELRKRLGRIPAEPFTRVSELPESAQTAALELAQASIDHFMRNVLFLFTSIGTDLHLGQDHALRYKLILEIIERQDPKTVVDDEILNRGGAKAFMDYFGRWLNRDHCSTNVS
jgi:hypothetical protein